MDKADERDAMRPGERVAAMPAAFDASVYFIGRISTPWKERGDCPRRGDAANGPDCELDIDPRYAAALTGLERYEHLCLLYWMDRARRDVMIQNPRHDGRLVGSFALRSPVRANPIGVSVVRLLGLGGCRLTVRGLDCVDGTPLIDIKPEFTGGRKPCHM